MNETPTTAPSAGPARFWQRLAVTAASMVASGLAVLVPAAGVDRHVLGMVGTDDAGGSMLAGPFALGLRPFLVSFVLVELMVLIVAPARRHGDQAFRRGMIRAAIGLGVAVALGQGWTQAMYLEGLSASWPFGEIVAWPGLQFKLLYALSAAAGSCVLLALAAWVTRRGVGNGFAALLGAGIVASALDGAGDLAGLLSSSTVSPFAAALSLLLWGALLAALCWVFARQPARGAFRALPIMLPTSGVLPLDLAFTLMTLPAMLAGIIGAPALQELAGRFSPGTWLSWAVIVVAIAAVVPLASHLFYFRRREALLAPPLRALWLRAWLLSGAGLLGLTLALAATTLLTPTASALAPSPLTLLVAAAIAVDLARELRVRWRARARGVDLEPIAVHQDVADALDDAARLEPGRAVVQGLCFRSLTYVFGPYVPMVVLAEGAMGPIGPMGPMGQKEEDVPARGGGGAAAIAAAVVLCVVALGPLGWAAAWRQPLGLDFEGGVALVLEPASPVPRERAMLEQVRRASESLGGDVSVYERDGAVHLEAAGATGDDLARLVAAVTRPVDLRLLPVVSVPGLGPEVTGPDEASVRARLDLAGPLLEGHRTFIEPMGDGVRAIVVGSEAVLTGADVVSAEVIIDEYDGRPRIDVELTPAGGERFHQYTREHVGEMIAIVVDDRLSSAPVIQQPIPGGHIQITMGHDDGPGAAQELAARLAAGAGVPMRVLSQTVIEPALSPWLGRPLALALALLALLACVLAALRRRWPMVAAATGLLGGAVGLAGPGLLDAVLTSASLVAAAVVGLLAAGPVVAAGLRPRPGLAARLAASWPAWALLVAAAIAASVASPLVHGFARGVAASALVGLVLAIPIAAIALVALTPSRRPG